LSFSILLVRKKLISTATAIPKYTGGVWAAAVGASVAYSRRRTPQRATSLRLTLAVLGGAALAHHYYNSKNNEADLDHDFYSQLPSATDADGNENERWSW
jgi:hypothetical protein